jgi:hypothetical protein
MFSHVWGRIYVILGGNLRDSPIIMMIKPVWMEDHHEYFAVKSMVIVTKQSK